MRYVREIVRELGLGEATEEVERQVESILRGLGLL
jgi:hypothetical protein